MLERFIRYRHRSRIMNWLRPLPPLNTENASYALISTELPVFYVPFWIDDQLIPNCSLGRLYDYLQDQRAYFLFNWFWQMEEPKKIAAWGRIEQTHKNRYPEHRFLHLCNTTRQFQRFRDANLEAIFCNQNCLVDETIFCPLPDTIKEFDAIYDGRLVPHKRHHLAAKIPKLALIYAFNESVDPLAEIDRVQHLLAHGHFFNDPEGGGYRILSPAEVNLCLNRSRVGLCLSAVEGAMYASIQYLLAGLPVVSTHSEGGRDVMFDERFVSIVEATPKAVAEGVARLCREAPNPEFIRKRTLEKVGIHRRRLIELVQRIYDEEGVEKRFEDEWPKVFINKLFHSRTSHQQTIETLEKRRS